MSDLYLETSSIEHEKIEFIFKLRLSLFIHINLSDSGRLKCLFRVGSFTHLYYAAAVYLKLLVNKSLHIRSASLPYKSHNQCAHITLTTSIPNFINLYNFAS